jgi:2'-5' RNA ligase
VASFADVSRLFVAVWPPPSVAGLLGGLPRDEASRLRWTTPDQWHVTLRFLGDVDEAAALELFHGVKGRRVDAELGPTVERLGPELVVVPVRGLDALAAAVWAVSPDLGEPPHVDGFRGHLTVARQRGGGSTSADGVAVSAGFVVDEIALVRSDLHADGARYTTVTRRSLGA